MSIDVPQLDDADYEELLSRATKRVSAYADEWTDFNPHDPGVTILELLAWLTDTHSYELDQITDAHRRKYLQLLGVTPQPPRSASVRLDISPAEGQAGRLPAGTRLTATDRSGTHELFETDHSVTVTDTAVAAIVVDTGHGCETRTTANDAAGMYFRAFGDDPTPGSTFAIGFDGDPFDSTDELSLFVDFHDANLPDSATGPDDGLASPVDFEPSVEIVWEYCRQYPTNSDAQPRWERLAVLDDTTNSLYETGVVTLERPGTWAPTAWGYTNSGLFDHQPGSIWIRCRLCEAGYEIPPQFDSVDVNVVKASHRHHHTEQLEPTAPSSKQPPRTYTFDHTPVLSATVSVDGNEWTEVSDFDASGPTDRHYVLDRTAGELTVGDDQAGVRPPVDATVTATYVAGGGPEGNVPASATWQFSNAERSLGSRLLSATDVMPRGAATGGRAAESIQSAIDRFNRESDQPMRAVTEADFETLAERTPGVRIARTAVCVPQAPPEAEVSLAVVPYAPPDVRRPTPSAGVRRAVQRQLDGHRLLTDRITVTAPTYVGLDVSVSVTVTDRFADGGERSAIESRLESYLHPIYGFDGDGWPFGRHVSTADLREQLSALDVVDDVTDISLRTVGDGTVTTDGTVSVEDGTLFYLDAITIDTTVRPSGGA